MVDSKKEKVKEKTTKNNLTKENLFEGVQIPKEATKPMRKDVEKVVIKAKLSNEEIAEIQKGLEDIKLGNVVSEEEFEKITAEWTKRKVIK